MTEALAPDQATITRSAETMARITQQSRWYVAQPKRRGSQTLTIADDGRVKNEEGITLPRVSMQWPGDRV